MSKKRCNQCKLEKPLTEFNKCTSMKDGKQAKCKKCCRANSKFFRQLNPDYYWGAKNSYFVVNAKEREAYAKDYNKANKSIKIYRIDMPDGSIYIGATKRFMLSRLNGHLCDLSRFKRNKIATLPLLHSYLNQFTKKQATKIIKSAYVIREFEGTRSDMYQAEKEEILRLRETGVKMLNKIVR